MCKEPIYEGDEDYLVGLPPTNTSAPVTSREVAAPSAQFTDPFGQGFNHAAPVQQPTINGAPQQQSSSVDDLLDFNGSKTLVDLFSIRDCSFQLSNHYLG